MSLYLHMNYNLMYAAVVAVFVVYLETRERRESILRREFDKAIKIINKSLSEEDHLRFLHWDLHKNSQGYSSLYFSFISYLSLSCSVFY